MSAGRAPVPQRAGARARDARRHAGQCSRWPERGAGAYAARPGSARPRCCSTAPARRPAVRSPRSPGRVRAGDAIRGAAPAVRADARRHLDALPEPQQQALRVAFGLEAGTPRIGSSWVSPCSACSPRLPPSAPLCASSTTRNGSTSRRARSWDSSAGAYWPRPSFSCLRSGKPATNSSFPLSGLTLEGLTDEDARALLMAAVPGHLDEQVRDRIVAETRREPVGAARAAPRDEPRRSWRVALAAPRTAPRRGHLEEHYSRRIRALPEPTQRLLLSGGSRPDRRRHAPLACRADAWRHRVVRQPRLSPNSCSRSAFGCVFATHWFDPPRTRPGPPRIAAPRTWRSPRRPMAEVDPERRVWHLAAAATGPDEAVAVATRTDGGHRSSPRRVGSSGCVPSAFGRIDRRAGAARRARPRRGPRSHARRRVRRRSRPAGRGRGASRSTTCSAPGSSGSGGRSSSRPTPDPRRQFCCWRPPRRSSHLTSSSRGRRTWTPGWRPLSPDPTLGPAVVCRRSRERHDLPRRHRRERRRVICSSTVLRRWSPMGMPQAHPVCDVRSTRSSATKSPTTISSSGAISRRRPRARSGIGRAGRP